MGRRRVDMGAVVVSAVVGTILTLVNQGDVLFSGNLSLALAWMIPLNYAMSLALVVVSGSLMTLYGGDQLGGTGRGKEQQTQKREGL